MLVTPDSLFVVTFSYTFVVVRSFYALTVRSHGNYNVTFSGAIPFYILQIPYRYCCLLFDYDDSGDDEKFIPTLTLTDSVLVFIRCCYCPFSIIFVTVPL